MTGFSKEVRQIIRDRAENRCEMQVCCRQGGIHWEIHHRRPRGMGGTKRTETNQPACGLGVCADCHRYAESHREIALANGWLVRQTQTPSQVPVLYRHRWCLLSDDGGVSEASCVCGEIGTDGWYPGPCSCVEADV